MPKTAGSGYDLTNERGTVKLEPWKALAIGLAFVTALVGLVLTVSLHPAKAETSTDDMMTTSQLSAASEAFASDSRATESITAEQYAMARAGVEANYQAELRMLDELWAKAQSNTEGNAIDNVNSEAQTDYASDNMTALDWMLRPYYEARLATDVTMAPLTLLNSSTD